MYFKTTNREFFAKPGAPQSKADECTGFAPAGNRAYTMAVWGWPGTPMGPLLRHQLDYSSRPPAATCLLQARPKRQSGRTIQFKAGPDRKTCVSIITYCGWVTLLPQLPLANDNRFPTIATDLSWRLAAGQGQRRLELRLGRFDAINLRDPPTINAERQSRRRAQV